MTAPLWREFPLRLGMPHLVAGRVSEEALLKYLGAFQWQGVADMAGQPENGVLGEGGERLHFSMISVELGIPASRSLEEFDEGDTLSFHQRASVFGRKLVEGLFVFDKAPIPAEELAKISGPEDLAAGNRPWAYLTHGFIPRSPDTWAKLLTPKAFVEKPVAESPVMPPGIADHMQVERTGTIGGFPHWTTATSLSATPYERDYTIFPEWDLNALGLVYCARFPGILGTAERAFLRGPAGLSEPLLSCLHTERRRIYYFANAATETRLTIRCQARFLAPAAGTPPARVRTMGRFFFRSDLHRASDGVLMASALVERVLRVPGGAKPLLTEAERFLARVARPA